ncbi:hypothetical protein M405DRAFT_861015 [Rhizopogon salebrosus TDB-379]|nr:hypothetical protein M405DRAFT_861015 [Rhizopogon salebrosus TDB-379]
MLSPFRALSRQCTHASAFSRFISTPAEKPDLLELKDLVQGEAIKQTAVNNQNPAWIQQGVRRRFDSKLFIRPHYFSHDHRFKGPPPFPKRSLIGPGSKQAKKQDVFYRLGIDPLQEASNDVLMSSFVTEMGKIKHRAETGLTTKSQRKLGKAIRRAKMMGVIPVLSSARLPWN